MLGGVVVEREQMVQVVGDLRGGLGELGAVGSLEGLAWQAVACRMRILLGALSLLAVGLEVFFVVRGVLYGVVDRGRTPCGVPKLARCL